MGQTNKDFAKDIQMFIKACTAVNISPTARQASKWRMKKGLAYKAANHLV